MYKTILISVKSFVRSYRRRLAMGCRIFWVFLSLLQTSVVFSAEESPTFSRSSFFRTLQNKQLIGYVVKQFESPSLLSCGQKCMRNEWCTSTNYKMSSKKDGKETCELNKHDISLLKESINFHHQHGVTFLMMLKVFSILLVSQSVKMVHIHLHFSLILTPLIYS